ncbi:uncharacterized protein LOC136087480 [Hydra vulgaris]|uniref:Uncharacterized protein LOC136087480 n=1 Tax=Hydra vulgaris TaxID=6087 RepID=A0ABM4CWS7_HYDVU
MAYESQKVPEVNRTSNLLSDDENSLVFNQIGKRCANFVAVQNFIDPQEANYFCQKIEEKIRAQEQRNTDNTQSVATTSVAPSISLSPSSNDLKKKEKPGNKKVQLSKGDIGTPSDFRHVGHVGWDPKGGFDIFNVGPEWRKLFDTIGVTERQLKDEEISKFIYEFVQSHGGNKNATKELESGNADSALPPPTRSASLPISSQDRPQRGRASTLPLSIKRETTVKIPLALAEQADPLPPQRVPRGPSSPPQMFDTPLLLPLNTPTPSPQRRVSGAGTLPPTPFPRNSKSLTAQPAKQDLFDQVHKRKQLNKVEPQQKEAGDEKDNLLNAICLGAQPKAGLQLNHTSVADNDQVVEGDEELVIDTDHIQESGALPPPTRSASLPPSSQGRPQRGCASTVPLSIKREATVKTPLALAEQADPLPSQQVPRGPLSPPQMSDTPLLSPLNTPAPSPRRRVLVAGTLPPTPFSKNSNSRTAQAANQDLFDLAHQGKELNKVEPQQKEAGDGKDDLLNAICLDAQPKASLQLNHTSVADNDQGVEGDEELVIDNDHIQESGALPPLTRSVSLPPSSQGRPQRGCASTVPLSIKRETTVKTPLALAEQADPLHLQQGPRGPSSPPQMSDTSLLSPLNTPAPSPQRRVSGAGTLPPTPFPRYFKSLTAQPAKQDLFDQVHQGKQLFKVEPQQKETGDGKDDLLNSIFLDAQPKAGLRLSHTCLADNDQRVDSAEELVIDSDHIQESAPLAHRNKTIKEISQLKGLSCYNSDEAINSNYDNDVDPVFKCPITLEVMADPVVAADGFTYEKEAIMSWFSKGRKTSPKTNLPLSHTELIPNWSLKYIIEMFVRS